MPIRRKSTSKGQPYTPNPEPGEEYNGEAHVPGLTRRTRQSRGLLPKGKLPKQN